MSKARPVYPGAVWFSTRRVHKRQFLLRPSEEVNRAIEYIVAVIAERYGILLHAICVLSNHVHGICTDPNGRIVDFERDCHSFITRYLNTLYGDRESLWSREQSGRVRCAEPEAVVDKMGYTMANPVAAGLVKCGKNWPGVRRAWPARPRTVKRPAVFFRGPEEGGKWPDEATLRLHRPPGYEDRSDEELAEIVQAAIDRHEDEAREEARRDGKGFLGRRGVRKMSRYAYPSSGEERPALRPAIAARSKQARIDAIARDRAWLDVYEAAKARLRAGDRSAVFPWGTWKLRVYYGVACADPPGAASWVA